MQLQKTLNEEQLLYSEAFQTARQMKKEEQHVREELFEFASEHEAQKSESERKSIEAFQALNDAEEKLNSIEEVARDAKGAYYQVASDLEMAETVISKNDEDAVALKTEYDTLQRTNEQLINQLGATAKNSLEKEEYASVCKAEVEKADKALLAAVGNTARMKSELQQAEMAAEDADENWNAWYTDLQNGIDESETDRTLETPVR